MRERSNQTPWGMNNSSWARGWTTTAKRTRNWMCVSNSNNSLREDEQQWQGREFGGRGCSATRGERKKNLRGWRVREGFPLPFWSQLLGGVWVEAWTDSPATPLPKQLTAITFPSCQQKLLTEGGWNKTKKMTHGFSPFWLKVLQISPPHPYPWENHAPFDLVAMIVAGRIHLINYRCIFTWWSI